MQKLIFALIIAGVCAAPRNRNGNPIPGYECPEADIEDTGCVGPKDCLYPNPSDCHTFIQCNDAGLAYEMPCAADLVYNETMKECDYPSTTQCLTATEGPTETTTAEATTTEAPEETTTSESTTDEPTTTEAVTDEPTSTVPSSEETTSESDISQPSSTLRPPPEKPSTQQSLSTAGGGTGGPTPGSGFVCPEADIAATGCKGPKDCLYPNPDSCTSFIHCEVNADNKTGRPTVQQCPSNLLWNDKDKQCDYPDQSTCNKGSSSAAPEGSPTTTSVPSEETTTPGSEETTTAEADTTTPASEETTTSAAETTTEEQSETTTEEPSEETTTPVTTTTAESAPSSPSGGEFVCPTEDIINTKCLGPKDCLYPNPDSCSSFIQCEVNADGVTGRPTIKQCAPSTPPLEWNDKDKICDWPANSTCPKKVFRF